MYRWLIVISLVFTAIFAVATAHAETIPAAYQLTAADAEAAAAAALAEKGAGARVQAKLGVIKPGPLYESSKPLSARVSGLNFDKALSRWSGNLLVVSNDQVLTAVPVSGRYQEVSQMPVLKRQIRSGEVITAEDLDLMDFPLTRVRGESASSAEQLIGRSPRSVISPNRPVRLSEVSAPAIIKKNALVQMKYVLGSMEIVTTGQAMNDGGKNDVIEVRNLTSKALVRATVQDANSVRVGGNAELAGAF